MTTVLDCPDNRDIGTVVLFIICTRTGGLDEPISGPFRSSPVIWKACTLIFLKVYSLIFDPLIQHLTRSSREQQRQIAHHRTPLTSLSRDLVSSAAPVTANTAPPTRLSPVGCGVRPRPLPVLPHGGRISEFLPESAGSPGGLLRAGITSLQGL